MVVHRIGIQMIKNNVGFLPNAVENLFTANAQYIIIIHAIDKNCGQLVVYTGMYIARFRFVDIKVWSFITLPKLKKY